jgi:hypothetical protein
MKVARALVAFIDGSFLFVELARRPEAMDQNLICDSVVGLPNNTPADKPSIAVSLARLGSGNKPVEFVIPMARISGINVQDEYLDTEIKKDVVDMWTAGK